MENAWLKANKPGYEAIKRVLLEKDMEGSHAEIPLMNIHRMINGFETEVLRLQKVLDDAESRVKELENEAKKDLVIKVKEDEKEK